MLIGELARAAGMTVEGVRFYERRGLLPAPRRSRSGYRLYGPDALDRVAFIRQAQAIGLSLDEIRHILALSQAGLRPCQEVEAFMRGKVADIDRRLRELRALKREPGVRGVLLDLVQETGRASSRTWLRSRWCRRGRIT